MVDYSDPDATPEWTLRTLGVGTSVNHSCEVQVEGLKTRLHELGKIFNKSPFAKREGLQFSPEDFAYRLMGTSGDHASDQKKSHEILKIWRLEVILQRLGEEALLRMDACQVLVTLLSLKNKMVEEYGGQAAWDALAEDEKAAASTRIVQDIGKQIFEALPQAEQHRHTRFIRTGCCMHKDLNCVKGGVKEMGNMWIILKVSPIHLANKDNAAILAATDSSRAPTSAEKRAEEVSKRGGCHAATLGGMICRNKDKKKGQHDTYNIYMMKQVGEAIPYPDVSNTRYGSHGEAAATIIAYHQHFIEFMQFVYFGKDKPGETNIEKNFSNALKDPPTLTELCVLALYNIAISRPFMQHVRSHGNILELQSFFEKKAAFLQSIVDNPAIWTGASVAESAKQASLDGGDWDNWSLKALGAIKEHAPQLPEFENAVSYFVRGARETFVERFSDKFKAGNGIDELTKEERKSLYFSSTNDANEGGLGSWRHGQERRPGETLPKFNASYIANRNHMEAFVARKLTEGEDELYLIHTARQRDSMGLPKQLREAQIKADQEKVVENRRKQVVRQEKQNTRAAVLKDTANNLILDNADIDRLTNDELNRQLDFHHEAEKKLPMMVDEKVPLKSHMKLSGRTEEGGGEIPGKRRERCSSN